MNAAEKRRLLDAIMSEMEAQSPAVRQVVAEALDAAARVPIAMTIKPRRQKWVRSSESRPR